MSDINIPFLKLKPIPDYVNTAIQAVLEKGVFLNGKYSELFEADFKKYLNLNHFTATANCTDALEIILRSHEIGRGDEVIVPAFSWFSDASVVKLIGAKHIFADIDISHYGMDVNIIESLLSDKTKAVIVPHLFGITHPDISIIRKICDKHQVLLIEDCAQSHGSSLAGKKAGSFGHVAAFSFYPTKNLGALGDAGCIVSNSADDNQNYKLWANHGQSKRNKHVQLGRNSRMDELQAAILAAKLPYLDQSNERRRELAQIYIQELAGLPLTLPLSKQGHVYHQFVIRLEKRNDLKEFLLSKGIETDIHYPQALSDMDVFSAVEGNCPRASLAASTVLSLPIHPNHEITDVSYVCRQIKAYFKA